VNSSHEAFCYAGLVTLIGLALSLWSLRLWHRPTSLRPDSPMYRWIYFRWFSWRRSAEDAVELTDKQIRRYAVGGIVVGIIVVGVVIASMIMSR